jgi:hypothetical protein
LEELGGWEDDAMVGGDDKAIEGEHSSLFVALDDAFDDAVDDMRGASSL